MHTKIFSARNIHAINYLEFLNSKMFNHNALATAETNQNQLFAAKKTKKIQREHLNKENFWKTCIQLSKFREKHCSKLRIEIVVNLLAAMLNPKQPKQKGSPASL